jgi:hypothetical protein
MRTVHVSLEAGHSADTTKDAAVDGPDRRRLIAGGSRDRA